MTYDSQIEDNLRAARSAIVVWSKASWDAKWVRAEAVMAEGKGKLIPVRIDDLEIGLPFNLIQTIDLTRDGDRLSEGSATTLVRAIQRLVPKTVDPEQPVTLYWMTFNDSGYNHGEEFAQRVANICDSVGVQIAIDRANRHRDLNKLDVKRDGADFAAQMNFVLYYGAIKDDGFADDVMYPALRRFCWALNPFILHVGPSDSNTGYAARHCEPDRSVRMALPEPDTAEWHEATERVALQIAFRILRIRQNAKRG